MLLVSRGKNKKNCKEPPIAETSQTRFRTDRIDTMTSASAGDCPFCAISREYPHVIQTQNQDPSEDRTEDATYVILSTPHTIAFLDRLPLTKCHTLLIPREHFELLNDIPSEIAAEVGRLLPIVCRAVLEVSGSDGFNVVQNNGNILRDDQS